MRIENGGGSIRWLEKGGGGVGMIGGMGMICAVGASGEGTGGGIEWWRNGR